ncbi:hypothetical protein [Amycolatopsis sp. cmx-8-4]|uniref:hypothetical protein n=1 Tax=Amycolatopsis sp. cmx-8-4 TaxID=2790947 RepID=UPI00397CD6DF
MRWVLGGERIPRKLLVGLAAVWTFAAVISALLAFGGDLHGWGRWVQVVMAAFYLLLAVYYWLLYAHVRRTGRRG